MAFSIDLSGYRALITGVSSGIGAGIARALAEAGADLAGCGLEPPDDAGPQAFLRLTDEYRHTVHYRQCDLASADQPAALVAWAAEQLGGLDLLVSNAGRNLFAGAAECSEQQWAANIDLNLAAHWRLAQAAKAHLDAAAAPVVLVIASNHAYYTMPGCFPYNVAKAGLSALVQSLAIEWGPHIRAVGIAPGFINTPLADAWFESFPDPEAKRAQINALHPVGRLGMPSEIGSLCVFLSSPLAGFISGSTILIDGGRNAVMQDV